MEKETGKIKEINLSEIAAAIVQKIWLVVLCAVLCGAATFFYTANFITPLYRSSVSIYVNNTTQQVTSNANGISASDLATSQRLVNTYINILSSDTVLNKVAEEVDLGISGSGIRSLMSASAMGETEIFQVYISHSDPKIAAKIANAIAEVAPEEIANIVEGSSTKIIDYAKVSGAPYTPNKTTNTTYGMIAGALVAVLIIVLQVLLDVRVKSEEDLAGISNAPVLGLIPDLVMDIRGDYAYKGYGYTADSGKKKKGEAE